MFVKCLWNIKPDLVSLVQGPLQKPYNCSVKQVSSPIKNLETTPKALKVSLELNPKAASSFFF